MDEGGALMDFSELLRVIRRLKLHTPIGWLRLIRAMRQYGINVMALLCYAGQSYGSQPAIRDEQQAFNYKQLFDQSLTLAYWLRAKYGLQKKDRVAILCRNHTSLVQSIFAGSGLGVDLYFINIEMSKEQWQQLAAQYQFNFVIYDEEFAEFLIASGYSGSKLLSYHDEADSVYRLAHMAAPERIKLARASAGKLMLLTGGTTGHFKTAAHKPSLSQYIGPFVSIMTRLKLAVYQRAYIATPIFHGYGIALLFVMTAMGGEMEICRRFSAEQACTIIKKHQIEMVSVVPSMLHRMLAHSKESLVTLCCVASGGAELQPAFAEHVLEQLGPVLYNLYGTSEAGLNTIAAPRDLSCNPATIGRKIFGIRLAVMDESNKPVQAGMIGQLSISHDLFRMRSRKRWIYSGDMGYQDQQGRYYLCGRVDDRIVSAGENVFPIDVERVLLRHPLIQSAAVVGAVDELYGQRLHAWIVPVKKADLAEEQLKEWLRSRVARYQMPARFTFVEQLPYTAVGKLDRKQLKSWKGEKDETRNTTRTEKNNGS
ncbi:AMP-binding protein [Paenibacillus sp. GCM10027626]|uniref:AMP-binding protein n=1 Tax=Paenibacillus sp. GCM10027626 TaxID=3273411 RepID=UPI003637E58E